VYLADESRDDAVVRYLGDDAADDPAGLLYFLDRVFQDTTERTVKVEAKQPSAEFSYDPARPPALVILAGETTAANRRRLEAYLRGGGTVLYVARSAGPAAVLAELAGAQPIELAEAPVAGDVMLGEIRFDHPLFAPLAGPEFNDFTKIHFWKYRKLDEAKLPGAKVLARFEKGDPAVVEKGVEKGKLLVLASGWNPADSQLARSSKFVPLMACLLDYGSPPGFDPGNHLVGEAVPLPDEGTSSRDRLIHRPDGSVARTAPGRRAFEGTDVPGVYAVDTATGPRTFAVNLDPLESKTAALHVETLEQLGCRLVSHAPRGVDREHLRQLQNLELESRQKLWRWLILAAIGVLIVETWLAGRVRRSRSAPAEALTT
jgi:hypothetical protein